MRTMGLMDLFKKKEKTPEEEMVEIERRKEETERKLEHLKEKFNSEVDIAENKIEIEEVESKLRSSKLIKDEAMKRKINKKK